MQQNKSFTLIELLVVISVIGLLSSVVLVSFKGTNEKARISKALEFSQSINHALGANAAGIWRFEKIDAGNKITDDSGNKNNCTLSAPGPTITEGVKISTGGTGNALLFTGNNYLNCGNGGSLNITDVITIEAWLNPGKTQTTDYPKIVVKDSSYLAHITRIPPYALVLNIYKEGGLVDRQAYIGNVLNPDIWTHVAFVYDGRYEKIYKNGGLIYEKDFGSYKTFVKTGANLGIGNYSSGGTPFSGKIDDVRIYNQALIASEIQKHYAESLGKYGYATK